MSEGNEKDPGYRAVKHFLEVYYGKKLKDPSPEARERTRQALLQMQQESKRNQGGQGENP